MKKHYIALAITALTTVVGIIGIAKGGTLPMHWNMKGEVDRTGSSWELLIPMGIAIAMYLLFWFLEKHPEYSNTNLRREVKEKGKAMLSNYSANLNIIMSIVMLYVMLTITMVLPLTPVVTTLMAVILVGYTLSFAYKVRRLNRNAVKGDMMKEKENESNI